MKITMGLTHRCNLACRYCYAGKSNKADMSLETAHRIIDYAGAKISPGEKLEIGFFGGEPLLRFDLIRDTIDYVHEKNLDSGRKVNFDITTNGLLLTKEIIDFIKKEKIRLCLSIDGPKDIHDRNRRYPEGHGTFREAEKSLLTVRDNLDYMQVNAVYGPETLKRLPDVAAYFIENDCLNIHLNPDITASWPESCLPELEKAYQAVAEQYVACFKRGTKIGINIIDIKVLTFIKDGYRLEDKCGQGEIEWAFAPGGNVYPCERFIGEDDDMSLCLGNINNGSGLKNRCAKAEQSATINPECVSCSYSRYCMNWCVCTNYFMSGQFNTVTPLFCASEKALIRAAKYAFTELVENENELFTDHLLDYANVTCHQQSA